MLKKQNGFTMVELMVAITISLVLISAITAVYASSKKTYRATNNTQQLQEQGRAVLQYLGRYIEMAGYTPLIENGNLFLKNWDTAASGQWITGCQGGFNDATGNDWSCRLDAARPDALMMAFRTEDVGANGDNFDCLRQNVGGAAPVTIVNHFFLRQRTFVENGITKTVSELACEGSGNPGVSQPIFSGVQDLQLLYGLPNAAATTTRPEQYVTADLVAGRWDQVSSVKLCVLMRTVDDSVTHDARTYQDCQGNTVTPVAADGYAYRSFTALYVLRSKVGGFLLGSVGG